MGSFRPTYLPHYARYLGPIMAVALVPNRSQIISAGADGTIRRWDIDTGEAIGTPLTGHTGGVRALSLIEGSTHMVSAGADGTIRRWDIDTGQMIGSPLVGHTGPIWALTLSSDEREIVSGGADGTIRRWEFSTGTESGGPLTGHTGGIRAVALSPDNGQIVSAGEDGTLRRWDSSNGSPIGGTLHGHTGPVWALAIDDLHIVSGGYDGTLRIWNAPDGRVIGAPITGHSDRIRAIALAPDSARAYSAGYDGTVRRWDMETGQAIGNPLTGHTGEVTALVIDPRGTHIISAGGDGIRVWDARSGYPVRIEAGADLLADLVSDLETTEDKLEITFDVNIVAAILAAMSTKPPVSIALLGDWGSGKSSFMAQVHNRVNTLAHRSVRRPGSAFAANVKQVRFNAWHYSDDHLWVGLVEHLFQELAPVDTTEPATDRLIRLRTDLSDTRAEYEDLTRDLKAVDELDENGLLGAVRAPLRTLRLAHAAVTSARHGLRGTGWQIWLSLSTFFVCTALIATATSLRLLPRLGIVLGGVLACSAAVIAAWKWLATQTSTIRAQLDARKENLEAQLEAAEHQLSELDIERRLNQLLNEISTPGRYESYRGLVGHIHHDLRRLSEDLEQARQIWRIETLRKSERGEPFGEPPLQRIILYVDDLDRCAPQRVVDVLQGLNLLLSMKLFMVVVAVDPHWLLTALEIQHNALFEQQSVRDRPRSDSINPLMYLEKIFHVPFALRPMGSQASDYLRSLLPDAEVEATFRTSGPQASIVRSSAGGEDSGSPDSADVVRHTSQSASESNSGSSAPDMNLDPDNLQLSEIEKNFLAKITPLLPTPRAVKKMVNLYRLVRLSIPDEQLDSWVGSPPNGGPYQAAALLLGALVGTPDEAYDLLKRLTFEMSVEADVVDEFRRQASALSLRLAQLIESFPRDTAVFRETAQYRQWAPLIARYGFQTYGLFTTVAGHRTIQT
ncbi:P-loop NTPase fold protein [Nocardia brasiliensis]|uniref:P-loop NTPase fold protein n=1 Tax=Nocardia brasiliensis TaxID=37326 RepID=UPI002458FB2E|nr:P-loop NTPase fold protein [Nocardia brasiliensis]